EGDAVCAIGEHKIECIKECPRGEGEGEIRGCHGDAIGAILIECECCPDVIAHHPAGMAVIKCKGQGVICRKALDLKKRCPTGCLRQELIIQVACIRNAGGPIQDKVEVRPPNVLA